MKKLVLGALAAVAVAAPLALAAAPANATTVNTDGSVHVLKGEVQTAFHWNNADFDKNVNGLSFNIGGDYKRSLVFDGTCNSTNYHGTLDTVMVTKSVVTTKSAKDQQINGWDLTKTATTDYAHSTYNRAWNDFRMCELLGGQIDSPATFSTTTNGDMEAVTVTFDGVTKPLLPTPVA